MLGAGWRNSQKSSRRQKFLWTLLHLQIQFQSLQMRNKLLTICNSIFNQSILRTRWIYTPMQGYLRRHLINFICIFFRKTILCWGNRIIEIYHYLVDFIGGFVCLIDVF